MSEVNWDGLRENGAALDEICNALKARKQAEAEVARLRQAIGLMTTAKPDMPIDASDPVGMARAVCAEVARLKAALVIAFVQGAQWWEYTSTSATMWASDRNRAEAEAVSKQKAGTLGVLAGEKEAGR